MTIRPVDAVPASSSAGHRAGRDCPCGPVAHRDLATGSISVWVHRPLTGLDTIECSAYSEHQRYHRRDGDRWVCDACAL